MLPASKVERPDKQLPCPLCYGTGWEYFDADVVRECECRKQNRAALLMQAANIPKRYEHCTLTNYNSNAFFLGETDKHYLSRAKAVLDCRAIIRDYPNNEVGLLIVGQCGLGKTHLAVALLRELILTKNVPGLFYDFRDLLKEIQDSYNPSTSTSELKILEPIYKTDVLVLDELGANKPTNWVQETITQIINTRYNHNKLTIFTSNHLDERNSEYGEYGETLSDRIGVRLRSRLYEMCKMVPLFGDDYRKLKQQQIVNRFR